MRKFDKAEISELFQVESEIQKKKTKSKKMKYHTKSAIKLVVWVVGLIVLSLAVTYLANILKF